jgi:hypothetical protein
MNVIAQQQVILPGFVDGHLELFLLQLGPTLLVRTHYLRTRSINGLQISTINRLGKYGSRNHISTFKTIELVGIRDTDLFSSEIAIFLKEKICYIQTNKQIRDV